MMRRLLRPVILLLLLFTGSGLIGLAWQAQALVDHHRSFILKEGMWPTIEEERTLLELRDAVVRLRHGESVTAEDYQMRRDLAFSRAKIMREMTVNDYLRFSDEELALIAKLHQQLNAYERIEQRSLPDAKTAAQILPFLEHSVDISHELLNTRREVTYAMSRATITYIEQLVVWIAVVVSIIFIAATAIIVLIRYEASTKQKLAVSRDRIRIASELHDVINYHLAVILRLLIRVQKHTEQVPSVRANVQEARSRAQLALTDARTIIHALQSKDVQQPLDQAIQSLSPTDLELVVEVQGTQHPMPTLITFAAYRIAQEAIANTMKHAADVSRMTFTLDYQSDQFRLVVTDNGKPNAPGRSCPDSGMGLVGMRERVEQLGGAFEFGPTPHGYRICATIPMEDIGHASDSSADRGRSPRLSARGTRRLRRILGRYTGSWGSVGW